jgi:hypothetical protein
MRSAHESRQFTLRNEKFTSKRIGCPFARRFLFEGLRVLPDKLQIDHWGILTLAFDEVSKLVHQRVPKPIDAIKSKGQGDHRIIAQPETDSIDLGGRQ